MAGRFRALSAVWALVAAMAYLTAVALAAKPNQVKGGSYSGELMPATRGIAVRLEVSANGKQVSSLEISNIPAYCSSGGRPIPTKFKKAAISSKGTFTSKAVYVIKEGPFKGQVGETLKITGRFLPGRREQGTLTTTYPKAQSCSGRSSYSTRA
jgi:hypothetical protein